MMNGSLYPSNYDVERLREAAGTETEDKPVPNYKCRDCDNKQHIDDHLRTAPNFCESCETVQIFVKLKSE